MKLELCGYCGEMHEQEDEPLKYYGMEFKVCPKVPAKSGIVPPIKDVLKKMSDTNLLKLQDIFAESESSLKDFLFTNSILNRRPKK
jgi:hypothetical protein